VEVTICALLNLSFETVGLLSSYLIVDERKILRFQRGLKQRANFSMHSVQFANPREQLLLRFFRVTLEVNVKLICSEPIQEYLNVLNVRPCLPNALRTGGFGQERPSLDLREDEDGGCNDRD
jgi:hypothetical protein